MCAVELRFRDKAKLCLAFGLLIGWTAPIVAQGMAVSGKFAMQPTGAATYSIPIIVPPGTSGMTPSLSLSYNSQGRNGLVGVGWSLEGLPSISRCPRTLVQDGARGGVNYDTNDRFCIDGQRLISISGTYGADGTEYRTEIESFVKVVSRGTAGTGPAWFEVRTKAGQRLEFGNTTDSRVLAQGKTTARDWMVNKVSDTKGNYFSVTYINDTANGQVHPSRVDYSANDAAGLAAYNSVRFVYDTARPDVVPLYHAGSLIKTTVRLANVQTYAGANLVADYRLAYQIGSATGRSQLASVKLCDGSGACLPATTFGWQNGTITPTVIANAGGQNGTLAGYRSYVTDFNGDGLADILWDSSSSATLATSSGTRVSWTGTGGGNFTVNGNFAGQNGKLSGYVPIPADFNRDGRTDVWWYQANSSGAVGPTTTWLSSNAGTFAVNAGPTAPVQNTVQALMDADGDGGVEMSWFRKNNLTTWMNRVDGGVTPMMTTGCTSFPAWNDCTMSVFSADFTGDGIPDLFWLDNVNSGVRSSVVWRGAGDGTFFGLTPGRDTTINGFAPNIIDVNGDGRADILWDSVDAKGLSKGQRLLWLGKGDGTFVAGSNVSGQDGTLSGYRPYAGDFNGDGLSDVLWVQSDTNGLSSGARVLWQGKGDGTFTVVSNFGGQDGTLIGYVPILADFNGDGKTDVLWDSRTGTDTRSTGTRVLWLSDGVAADLMITVTSGTGATVGVTYKPLTDSTVYTKDETAVSPLIDLQGPMFAATRVDTGNGVGGTLSTSYKYAGAKANLDGRGFFGFRQMTITDLQTNVAQTTIYRQDFPFASLVASETTKLGATTLGTTKNTYGATALGGTRFQVFLTQSQSTKADLDGSVLPTTTSTYQYDGFGNATQIAVSATDGFQKTTTSTYSNDQTNWLLGRLTRASVASLVTQPAPPPPPGPVDAIISSNAYSLNLWDHLVAHGLATPGVPGSWVVTIATGVTVGSKSNSIAALDTGTFPSGSTLKIINNGSIVGLGGNGGNAGWCDEWGGVGPGGPGGAGGAALRARVATTIVNNGKMWGGGGGGGGGGVRAGYGTVGGGGGGGAGSLSGIGGSPGNFYAGESGTLTKGGNGGVGSEWAPGGGKGGDVGQPGVASFSDEYFCSGAGNGGPPGAAVTGNSFITWTVVGDRKGPIN